MALIGDRERERAVALLKAQYLRGRITVEELSERLEVALGARRESEVQTALAGVRAGWREQDFARAGLDAVWRAIGRAVFAVAVWALWWAVSLVLLVGLVASVVLQGLSPTTVVLFSALWLVATLAARRVTRRDRKRRDPTHG